jgi:hypothetical protein
VTYRCRLRRLVIHSPRQLRTFTQRADLGGRWSPTESGRAAHADRCAAELADAGCQDQITGAYRLFQPVNHDFLAVCTAWQLRTIAGRDLPNDHRDSRYDAAVISRLHDIHRAAGPICTQLTTALRRYQTYQPRLAEALRHIEAGDHQWFIAGPGSYHTTWFELHEDLLVTLRIPAPDQPPLRRR